MVTTKFWFLDLCCKSKSVHRSPHLLAIVMNAGVPLVGRSWKKCSNIGMMTPMDKSGANFPLKRTLCSYFRIQSMPSFCCNTDMAVFIMWMNNMFRKRDVGVAVVGSFGRYNTCMAPVSSNCTLICLPFLAHQLTWSSESQMVAKASIAWTVPVTYSSKISVLGGCTTSNLAWVRWCKSPMKVDCTVIGCSLESIRVGCLMVCSLLSWPNESYMVWSGSLHWARTCFQVVLSSISYSVKSQSCRSKNGTFRGIGSSVGTTGWQSRNWIGASKILSKSIVVMIGWVIWSVRSDTFIGMNLLSHSLSRVCQVTLASILRTPYSPGGTANATKQQTWKGIVGGMVLMFMGSSLRNSHSKENCCWRLSWSVPTYHAKSSARTSEFEVVNLSAIICSKHLLKVISCGIQLSMWKAWNSKYIACGTMTAFPRVSHANLAGFNKVTGTDWQWSFRISYGVKKRNVSPCLIKAPNNPLVLSKLSSKLCAFPYCFMNVGRASDRPGMRKAMTSALVLCFRLGGRKSFAKYFVATWIDGWKSFTSRSSSPCNASQSLGDIGIFGHGCICWTVVCASAWT